MPNRLFASPAIAAEEQPDGTLLISSKEPVAAYPRSVLHSFHAGSQRHPDRILVAEKISGTWSTCAWSQARERVDRIAQGLLNRGVAGKPVLVLSHNSITHLLVTLAAYTVGSPVVPTSVAYSLQSSDHARLRRIANVCDPAVVFAEDSRYAAAQQAIGAGRLLLSADDDAPGSTPITDIEATPTGVLADCAGTLYENTVAKIMFTSGSTGAPKGVINTHGMLSANQQQIRQVWPFLTTDPPVLLDWLPWSHTFGGNHNVNMVLVNGGTLWIDTGRPSPDLIGQSAAHLAEIQPTVYFNVPAGYAALVPLLRRDRQCAQRFLSGLRVAFFAGAALPQQLWKQMEDLAAQHGSRMQMTTSWGMTETAPAATTTHFRVTRSDCVGVPLPGVELKLVPPGPAYELLVRGPNVTPGYYRRPELHDTCFDSDGFLRTGDAVKMAEPGDPNKGLVFDGRLAENFKLSTGTFVTVGTLRPKLLSACEGLLQDAVLCGEGSEFVSALVWPAAEQVHRVDPDGTPDEELRRELENALHKLTSAGGGSSQRIERLLILTTPPDLEEGEITDKGYINQRTVRTRRAEAVAELIAPTPSSRTVSRLPAAIPASP